MAMPRTQSQICKLCSTQAGVCCCSSVMAVLCWIYCPTSSVAVRTASSVTGAVCGAEMAHVFAPDVRAFQAQELEYLPSPKRD
jgi:hypothetical protein